MTLKCCAGKQKKTRRYATMKRMLSLRDERLKEKDRLKPKKKEKKDPSALKEREVPQHPSCLFFQYNTQLGPPYHILVDTNFINFSIKAKLDLVQSMMDCLYAKCIPCITDCVMAEIEKLGQKYRVALSTSVTLWLQLIGTSNEESGRSLEFLSCIFLTTDTTLNGCQMIMELLGSNSYLTTFACLSLPAFSVVS
ncbi:rRNA-processing protein FCF1 homolog isoform X2 [Chionomys nivalis]|uniref:rRNA-processing protein FCF1 homolog isoform X2 n=1 Tax=Chionomys nivalis TaxID=269649 RepID=UPI00259A9C52|nr:rRNA-processing protein FCF1 homolog isoform X2 [Chionomys nivalis]